MYDVVNRRWCPYHVLNVSVYISILLMSIFPTPRLLQPPGYLIPDFFQPPGYYHPPSIPDCRVYTEVARTILVIPVSYFFFKIDDGSC